MPKLIANKPVKIPAIKRGKKVKKRTSMGRKRKSEEVRQGRSERPAKPENVPLAPLGSDPEKKKCFCIYTRLRNQRMSGEGAKHKDFHLGGLWDNPGNRRSL